VSEAEVLIIDSGGANLASLRYALDRLGARSLVSANPAQVGAARRVLLPGVGAAADAMARLRAAGLVECLQNLRQPLLGICLGMQLLFAHSEEGDTMGLGLLSGKVCRMPSQAGRPVPHMGWNTCQPVRDSPLLAGLRPDDHFYFAHSYAATVGEHTCAATTYGHPMSAVVQRDNFHGVQFHPERSAAAGERLLRNFLDL